MARFVVGGIWTDLDWVLGALEPVLVIASLVWVVWAHAGKRRSRHAATALCVATALTIAQPFGIRAARSTSEHVRSQSSAEVHGGDEVHTLRLLGVPLFGFRLYVRDYVRLGVEESGSPTGELKVRSWLWPALLTNAAAVDPMCEGAVGPCWDGSASRARHVELSRSGGSWRVLVRRPDGSRVPGQDAESVGGYYELGLGVVSLLGAAYWAVLALGAFTVFQVRRARRRDRRSGR